MKTAFLFLIAISTLSFCFYEEPGPIVVNFIMQNPKYYPNSKSYFLVSGMRDKKLQQMINDSLLRWYMGENQFYPANKTNLPKAFKDRKLNKGETLWLYNYGCDPNDSVDGVVFKDKDSLVKKGTSGYKKCGHSICTWGTQVFKNEILLIGMEYNPASNPMKIDDPMYMDLRTAKKIHPSIKIVFPDSLQGKLAAYMKPKIEDNFKLIYGYSKAEATPTLPIAPIIVNGFLFPGDDYTIYLNFKMTGITRAGDPITLDQAFPFSLSELARFTDGNYLKETEAYFK